MRPEYFYLRPVYRPVKREAVRDFVFFADFWADYPAAADTAEAYGRDRRMAGGAGRGAAHPACGAGFFKAEQGEVPLRLGVRITLPQRWNSSSWAAALQ